MLPLEEVPASALLRCSVDLICSWLLLSVVGVKTAGDTCCLVVVGG
jgi:hypothetical protein